MTTIVEDERLLPTNENSESSSEVQSPSRPVEPHFSMVWALCAGVGCVQALLASAVGHSVGIAVGLTTTATAIPLLLKSTHNLPPALSNARQIACSILRDARVARATGIVCKSTAVFAGLLTLVRIFGSDMFAKGPLGIGFPDMCPPGYEIGCTRVAVTNGNSPMRPLVIQAGYHAVLSAVGRWVHTEPRSRILKHGSDSSGVMYVHSKHLSFLWGFPDDLWVRLTPVQGGSATLVEAQGSLRVGKGDMGVNGQRIKRMYEYLDKATFV